MTTTTTAEEETMVRLMDPAKQQAIEGIDFMLEHFNSPLNINNGHPLFPRTVATMATGYRQVEVYSLEEIIQRFEESDFIDCYMSAFPSTKLWNGKPVLYRPCHILIDIDRGHFASDQEFEKAVQDTVQNIIEIVGSTWDQIEPGHWISLPVVHPTVIATGNGVHIHQSIDMPVPLERVTEVSHFNDVSNEFLRYLERRLSNWKSDPNHNISFRSSLLRVPGTYNLKCIKSGKEPSDVRILSRWNKVLVRPSTDLMHDFLAYMIQKEIIDKKASKLKRQIRVNSAKERAIVMAQRNDDPTKADYYRRRLVMMMAQTAKSTLSPNGDKVQMNWIETVLLQTPIDDYRKEVIFWILVPYLCTIKGIEDDEVHQMVDEWLDKCEQLRSLEPSRRDFDRRIDDTISWVREHDMRPTRLETIKEDYPDLYKKIFG